jgi:lipopolysaccharide/colanic/teichoic acid biosynthesis glycosyltransferase
MTTVKRLVDIALSFFGLLFSVPLFAVISIAIWLEDGLPIIFRQRRIGCGGKIFYIHKFRKFINGDFSSSPHVTLVNDKRYSRVGKFLDKTKLNELPQLLNVLRGDMSIVGPRPEIPAFRHCFDGPHEALLEIKPGIFGPSQTIYRNEAELYPVDGDANEFYESVLFPRKAEVDIAYYSKATTMSDMAWIIRSLIAVFMPSQVKIDEWKTKGRHEQGA